MMKNFIIKSTTVYFATILIILSSNVSFGIPSFARQTNLPCSSCHYVYPELTPFGRLFKLNAYTLTGIATIQTTNTQEETTLKILNFLPLSAMMQTSYTKVAKDVTGKQNDIVEFPQQLSLFVAGEISPTFGTFIQITYDDQSGNFGLDNTDLRYANHTTIANNDLLYGITLNNGPTIEDVWNSTPAWGFPFVSSGVAPSPAAASLIDGALAGNVAGLGVYSLYNNLVYGEISVYRSTPQGGPFPADASSEGTIKGVSPYWRVALQKQWSAQYAEVGTYGLSSNIYPMGISGLTDDFTDIGVDAQYENTFSSGTLIAHTTYINEKQNLNATYAASNSSNPSDKLSTFRLDCSYNLPAGYAFSLGYFNTSGDNDMLYGTINGSPDSNGFLAQVSYLPWLNTQFTLQYVAYNQFDGGSNNYNGAGRNASDNNTIYLVGWVVF
jgi:hypothetical protein